MRVIKPEVITEGVLTSSSIPEPDASVGEFEWIADRFSGLVLTNKSYPSQGFVHGVEVSGIVYVLETLDVNIGSNGVMHKYDSNGVHIGSFSVDSTIKSFGVSEDLNRLVGVDPSNGYVHEYNLSSESFIQSVLIAGDIPTPTGITYGDNSYFILNSTEKKIARFDSNFNLQSSNTILDDSTNSLWSLHFLAGGFCSYINRLTAELKSVKIGTSDIQWAIPVNVAAGNDFNIFGHYLSDGDPFVINYSTDIAYRYKEGVYDGFYKVDDKVIKTSTHTQYQCTIATADDPEVGVDKIPQTWVKIGATNKWKVFDEAVNTQSTDDSPLVMEFLPGQNVTSIAGFNLSGASTVNITVTDPVAGEVYNKDIALISQSNVVDWFTYYWSPIISRRFFIATDLPPYINATIKVTITGSGSVGIGALVFGSLITIGEANYGTSVAMQDLSRLSEDDFGNVTVTRRESRKLTNYDVTIENARKDYVYNVLDDLRTIPSVWIGEGSQNDITVTYGYHYDLLINIDYPTICSTTLQVRGLV